MLKTLLTFGVLAIALLAISCGASVDEDQFDNGPFTSMDQLNPPNEVIRVKAARPADWCPFGLRAYPAANWVKDRSSDTFAVAKKRGYMGIEIPDFITATDGSQNGGNQQSKPRYFKNG